MGLLCPHIILCLYFLRTSMVFSLVHVPLHIPNKSVGRVPSLHTLSKLFLEIFRDGQSHQCKVILIGLLIGLSLKISSAEHLFMCLMAICVPSWKKYPFLSLPIDLLGCLSF